MMPPLEALPEREEPEEEEMAGEMKEEPEIPGEETPSSPTAEEGTPSRPPVTGIVKKEYKFPPLSLLHTDHAKGESQSDVAKNASIIESTLKSFGVMARVIHASVGPTVTRFELRPEVGVRVSRIEGLSNELAMALAATHIRI